MPTSYCTFNCYNHPSKTSELTLFRIRSFKFLESLIFSIYNQEFQWLDKYYVEVFYQWILQKQPYIEEVLQKTCSENMQQTYRRTLMPKCDFNKVALLKSHFGMGVLFAAYFQNTFLKNTSGRLLLLILAMIFVCR